MRAFACLLIRVFVAVLVASAVRTAARTVLHSLSSGAVTIAE
jgi:hypothetical protein